MSNEIIERLHKDLALAKAKTTVAEKSYKELSTKYETLSARLEETRTSRIHAETINEVLKNRINEQKSELIELRSALNKAQEDLRKQQSEIGRLSAVSEMVERLQNEREQSLKELAQVKADVEQRIVEEVNNALQRINAKHKQAELQWTAEKKKYLAEISKLKDKLEQEGIINHIFPTDLASKLAKVLDELAEGKPVPGRQFSTALTALEVEARGVLEAPRKGEEQLRFVTVEPGKVDPNSLSTLKMTFKLLPRLVSQER